VSTLASLVTIALVLAVALFGMVTRLVIPLIRSLWAEQTRAAEAQIVALQQMRLPRSHRRPKFGRAA
jgi:hypothetical protein